LKELNWRRKLSAHPRRDPFEQQTVRWRVQETFISNREKLGLESGKFRLTYSSATIRISVSPRGREAVGFRQGGKLKEDSKRLELQPIPSRALASRCSAKRNNQISLPCVHPWAASGSPPRSGIG